MGTSKLNLAIQILIEPFHLKTLKTQVKLLLLPSNVMYEQNTNYLIIIIDKIQKNYTYIIFLITFLLQHFLPILIFLLYSKILL